MTPARKPISRIKPIFDWQQNRYVDPTDATYLDRLGSSSAIEYATVVKALSQKTGFSLPVSDQEIEQYLEATLAQLTASHPRRETPSLRYRLGC